jgi:hypothetical protein
VERGRWECDVEKATLETDVFGNVRREINKKMKDMMHGLSDEWRARMGGGRWV